MTPLFSIEISGTGAYVPEHVLTNDYFTSYLDTSDEWILTRTGIRERRRAGEGETTSTMAAMASKKAIEDAGIDPKEIDLLVCATATGDCLFPSTAAFIQGHLGLSTIPAFDISAACAGFLYGTVVASSLLHSGNYKRALLIGAETLTRFADPDDRRTVVLFGDAAGAAILTKIDDPSRGIIYCNMGCEGSHAEHIWLPAGGSRMPATQSTVSEKLHTLHMRGREVYKFAVQKMQCLIDEALEKTGLAPNDLKMVIPHQSNLRIIESVRERLKLPKEKVSINIDRFGNTSAASVILALDEHRRNGHLQTGDLVLFIAIGAGLAWSTIIVRL